MEIKLSKMKRVLIFWGNVKTTYVDNGYWYFNIPFTKIVIHYYKLPF